MANTYTLIEAQTLASSAASVTFSSIPATYTDLVLKINARGDIADTDINLYTTFNSDSATNYSANYVRFQSGTTAAASNVSNQTYFNISFWSEGTSYTSNTFSSNEVYIPNYTMAQYKPFSTAWTTENNASDARGGLAASLWRNTAAITSITLTPYSGNLITGSSFYLYGIKNS
jgi:hypothetical protein